MVQVYEEPLCRRHYAPFLSFTNFVRLLVLVGIIVSSFAICFASGGFWPTTRTIRTQPHVTFMHDMVVVLEGSRAGNELFWSTFPNLNAAMGSKYASMTASTTEEDRNFDGVADVIDVRLTARGIGAANVHSAKVLMQFSYIVDESRIDMNMKSLAYASFASPLPGVGLYVDGTLRFDQVAALDEGKLRDVYNYNILPEGRPGGALMAPEVLRFDNILDAYNERNETTYLDNVQYVWDAGNAADVSGFDMNIRIRIPPEQEFVFKPKVWYMLKVGWVQFISIFLIFYAITRKVRLPCMSVSSKTERKSSRMMNEQRAETAT